MSVAPFINHNTEPYCFQPSYQFPLLEDFDGMLNVELADYMDVAQIQVDLEDYYGLNAGSQPQKSDRKPTENDSCQLKLKNSNRPIIQSSSPASQASVTPPLISMATLPKPTAALLDDFSTPSCHHHRRHHQQQQQQQYHHHHHHQTSSGQAWRATRSVDYVDPTLAREAWSPVCSWPLCSRSSFVTDAHFSVQKRHSYVSPRAIEPRAAPHHKSKMEPLFSYIPDAYMSCPEIPGPLDHSQDSLMGLNAYQECLFTFHQNYNEAQSSFLDSSNHEKTTKRFRKTQIQELMLSYKTEPYPSDMEKERLARTCRLSVKQVNNWFTNKRNRSKSNPSV